MAKKLKVVVVPVGKDAYVADIDNEPAAIQELVGGYYNTMRFTSAGEMFEGTSIVYNEDGQGFNKLGMRGTFLIVGQTRSSANKLDGLGETHAKVLASLLNSNGG